MAVDLSNLVQYTVQLSALQQAQNSTTDPAAKAVLAAQISTLQAQITAEAQHQQTQAENQSMLLNTIGMTTQLGQLAGSLAPTIINLFKKFPPNQWKD